VVPLPQGVDPNQVEARYEHGVLTLKIKKSPDAAPKRFEVQTKQLEFKPWRRPVAMSLVGQPVNQAARDCFLAAHIQAGKDLDGTAVIST
jgi:hypothetical protein